MSAKIITNNTSRIISFKSQFVSFIKNFFFKTKIKNTQYRLSTFSNLQIVIKKNQSQVCLFIELPREQKEICVLRIMKNNIFFIKKWKDCHLKHLLQKLIGTNNFYVIMLQYCIVFYFYLFLQPAHVKACFLGSSLTIPITEGKLNLGTWQGVWLCEHRDHAGSRKLLITLNGCLRDATCTPLSPVSPMASTSS